MSDQLKKAREIINETDAEMAKLFLRRMEASKAVAEFKKEHGMEILDRRREDEVIRRNAEQIGDEELRGYYMNFLKRTMEVSRAYQSKLVEGMRVAFCGTEGAFAHIATKKLFPTAQKIAFPDFPAAYQAVVDGDCDVAVLPVENSYNGEVGQVTDLMFSGPLYVNGTFDLAVTQDLVGLPDASPEDIREVISHPQALGQCRDFIRSHGLTPIEYANTALAAKYVKTQNRKSLAAIASSDAAELFGLKILQHNINEAVNNTTRFMIFSRSEHRHASREMGVHTILLFTVRNEAGALAKAIDVIGNHGFNMRSIRSRPSKELLWQYYFYVEAEGNIHTEEGQALLKDLSNYCQRLKAVGTYITNEG